VSVGVVASELSVVNPKHALCTEILLQTGFDLVFRQWLVAMRRKKTATGGEDGAASVALYASAFEHEVKVVNIFTLKATLIEETTVESVVKVGTELLAPSVETEVEEEGRGVLGTDKCQEAMIACPGVV
jgi:hypothetical protein